MAEPDYSSISVMEDLDPEPERGGGLGSFHARELVLGLALLFGVLGWAGWQWWRDESSRTNYSHAQQAATARQWDDALAHFSAAQGYKDADTLADNARKQIQQRDSQYQAAQMQHQSGPSVMVLRAARAVQTIQPGYRDVDSFAIEAEKRVYADALNGVVALRTQADPPGLYYRDLEGWVWLQGSDKWSEVRSMGARDRLVYDVPGVGWKPPVTPTTTPSPYGDGPGSPQLAGRRLMVMQMSGLASSYSFAPLSLDPAQYDGYICGEQGVWATRNEATVASGVSLRRYLPVSGVQLTYQSFSSPVTATMTFTGSQSIVVDVGQTGDRVLLAGYGQPVGNQSNMALYIAGPDGSHPRALYSLLGKGGFDSAHLSPDGRYALLVTYEPVESAAGQGSADTQNKERLKAILLDTEGNKPPRVLAETVKNVQPAGLVVQYQELTIAATFLNTGQLRNKLLLAWVELDGPHTVNVRLIDAGKPDVPVLITSVEGSIETTLRATEDADSGLLLTMVNIPRSGAVDKAPAQLLLHITAGGGPSGSPTATKYEMLIGKMPVVLDARIQNGALIYGGVYRSQENLGFSAITIPLSQIGKYDATESTLYDVTLPKDSAGPSPYDKYHLGAAALAYIDNAELIAHSYEDGTTITLEKGITGLFDLDSYYRYHWFF